MTSLHEHPVGGILAVPANDTLKQSAGETNSDIETTLDRSRVWLAQTPQMFRYRLIVNCLKRAIESKVAVTDEASALEWAGYTPRLVQGDSRNHKVTTPEDLTLAEFLLAAGQGGATG
jgi:2-C-methyl-D-erythritol 4-phosphate cytidylyltransferase